MSAALLTAALDWHHHGLTVVPARPDGTKAPAAFWKQYQTTRPTEDQLRAWFHNGSYDGFGIITGTVSGNLEMFEFEGRARHLVTDLTELMVAHGLADMWTRLLTGYVETTPTDGLHLYYRVNGTPARNTKLARRPATPDELATNPREKVKVLVETRGEGGFSIVAPAAGRTHPSGRAWTATNGTTATIPTITGDERDTLYAIATLLDRMPTVEEPNPRPTPTRTTTPGTRPGDDFNARASWDDILHPHGWTKGRALGRGHAWTRPGKSPRDGISATTGQSTDGVDRLYVFSTSTEFDTEKPYSKFAAYALLEHGGDWGAATRALSRQGYGDAREEAVHELVAPPSPAQELRNALAAATPQPEAPGEGAGVEWAQDDSDGALPPSWRPVDLTPYLDGTWTPTAPTMLLRDDGIALLYPGLVHDFHGESESGKSLVIQAEASIQLAHGNDVLYVDFESDAGQVVHRLLDLGATPAQVAAHLTYIRPEASPYTVSEAPEWAALLDRSFTLAVLDGVTDALGQFGGSTKENDDIAAWHRKVPRTLARHTGAAVVLVDHVTKNTDTRGRFAIGGQAKMASIDGASYSIEITDPIGKGIRGTITMRIGKDRPGEIRAHCGKWRAIDRTQEAARITVDSTTGTHIQVTVSAPQSSVADTDTDTRSFKPTGIMEKLSRILEAVGEPLSKRSILKSYKDDGGRARDVTIYDALNRLIAEGWIVEADPFRGHPTYAHQRPYRQVDDPDSDAYETPVQDLTPPPTPSASKCFPSASRKHLRECFPASPPVGGSGSTQSPDGSATASQTGHPSRKGFRYDYQTGEWVDPNTGEIWEG